MGTGTGLTPLRAFRHLMTVEPFRALQQRMNHLFKETFGLIAFTGEEHLSLAVWAPPYDIYETDTEIVVKVELPGVKKEDVKVSIENNVLTISGERRFEEETPRESYHQTEHSYGPFMLRFMLPITVGSKRPGTRQRSGHS